MYDTLSEFLRTFSSDHSLLWALMVTGAVAGTSLLLFLFWELVLRLVFFRASSRKNRRSASK